MLRARYPKSRRTALRSLLLSIGIAAAGGPAAAQGDYLLGDWDGARTRLEEQGIRFDIGYTSEDALNISGGKHKRAAHAGQLALGAQFDLERLWGWSDTELQVSVTHRDGSNLNERAGLNELLHSQEIYGRGKIWRLGSLWLGKRLADGRIGIKLGRMAVGDDFNTLDCPSMNLTFCGSQPAMIVGDYWFNGPLSQWGAVLDVRATRTLYLRTGVYQVNPSYAEEDGGGLRLAPSGTTGALTPFELGWNPSFDGLAGHYAIGGWYSSAPRADAWRDRAGGSAGLSGLDPAMRGGAYGAYFSAHQQFTRGRGGDPQSGLRGYFNLVLTDQRTGKIDRTANLLAIYTGPAASRPHDQIGVGVGLTHVNSRYARYLRDYDRAHPGEAVALSEGHEYTAVLFYAWKVRPGLTLRPELQYVVRPGGSSANGNVFVAGITTRVSF